MQLFNTTFFKFTLGFLGILLVSFAVTIAAGYYDAQNEGPVQVGDRLCAEGEC